MCETHIAEKLMKVFDQSPSLFEKQKINIFKGREWFLLSSDDELKPKLKEGEKMDYIFITAESFKKYLFHSVYHLNLKKVLEKYGNKNTKVIIFSCCNDCDGFVKNRYGNIITDFLAIDSPVETIAKKYFADFLAINIS